MKIFITFLFIILLFVSCHKNENHEYSVIKINDSIKSIVFKPGSYWIYKSVENGNIDCTYVSNLSKGTYGANEGLGSFVNVEYYLANYVSTQSKDESNFRTRIEFSYMLMNPNDYYPWGKDPVLYTYYNSKSLLDWHSNGSYKFYDSLKINNITYYNVQECGFLSNLDSISFFTDLNIGFIKKILHNKTSVETWNLIRYNIVK